MRAHLTELLPVLGSTILGSSPCQDAYVNCLSWVGYPATGTEVLGVCGKYRVEYGDMCTLIMTAYQKSQNSS